MRKSIILVSYLVAAVLAAGVSASATPYVYGVMADTQWNASTTANPNTVSYQVAQKCNDQFVSKGVQAVFQVGDLTDNGSTAGLQSRLDANSNLGSTPFYALRGNHEDGGITSGVAADVTFFQSHYMPSGTNVEIGSNGLDYAVTLNGTKFVMLDITDAYSTSAMDSATTWMNSILNENDHTTAFVLGHKNLSGRNHHDTMFQTGSNEDANPAQQNAFFASLASHNAMYISGHDHQHDLSTIISPDGQYTVSQLICQSDSYKFYNPSGTPTSRRTTIQNEQNRIGYYIFTVDGATVNIDYYHSDVSYAGNLTETQASALTFSKASSWSYNGSPVPEPSSALAMLSGLAGVAGMIIRKKR